MKWTGIIILFFALLYNKSAPAQNSCPPMPAPYRYTRQLELNRFWIDECLMNKYMEPLERLISDSVKIVYENGATDNKQSFLKKIKSNTLQFQFIKEVANSYKRTGENYNLQFTERNVEIEWVLNDKIYKATLHQKEKWELQNYSWKLLKTELEKL